MNNKTTSEEEKYLSRNREKYDYYPEVKEPLELSFTWTAHEYEFFDENRIYDSDYTYNNGNMVFERRIYRDLRNRILEHIENNNLALNWAFIWHCDMDCDIETKTCRMTVAYGPANRLEYWKVQTVLEKQRLGLPI